MARTVLLGLVGAILAGCAASVGGSASGLPGRPTGSDRPTPMTSISHLRYVALGDSYTIGTSVSIAESWPSQLVAALRAREATLEARGTSLNSQEPTLEPIANLAVNGYTSRDVIEVELPQLDSLHPEFVSLLVGVNDVVQGVAPDTYEQHMTTILDDLVTRVGSSRILVLTTPDYTVTPAGSDYGDPVRQSAAIRRVNEIISTLAVARGITVVDIFDLSLRAAGDRSLVASDGLHPSGAQYALWVERIVATLLANR